MEKKMSPIWVSEIKNKKFYLFPENYTSIPGGDKLTCLGLDSKTIFVNLNMLEEFQITQAAATTYLKKELKENLQRAKQTFQVLQEVSSHKASEEKIERESAESILHKLISTIFAGEVPEPSSSNQDAIKAFKDFTKKGSIPQNIPTSLEEFFPKDDQGNMISEVMNRLHEIAGKLDKDMVDKKDNPAAWIEVLYKEIFADEIKRKKEAKTNRIKKTVNDSIAEGLRKRGIKPSKDF